MERLILLVRTGRVELPFPCGSQILSPNRGIRVGPHRSFPVENKRNRRLLGPRGFGVIRHNKAQCPKLGWVAPAEHLTSQIAFYQLRCELVENCLVNLLIECVEEWVDYLLRYGAQP